jgi:DHA1 family bicyclomycin/chloramphenicol resistance-like MFS transporter
MTVEGRAVQAVVELPLARWRFVLLLGLMSAFGPLSMDGYLPSLPAVGTDLQTSASAAQLTLSAFLVGLALGQVIVGPWSDRLGRRRPLLFGVGTYVVVSVLCAMAPSVWMLVSLRIVQGLAGASGLVIARASIRDLYQGVAAAQFFGSVMMITALMPVLAPILGAQVLAVGGSWRSIFVVLAVFGAAIFVFALRSLRETLPPERRRTGGLRAMLRVFPEVLRDRVFVSCLASSAGGSSVMFAYIAGSAFVLQQVYGLTPTQFSLAFALNAVGIWTGSQITRLTVARFGTRRLLRVGLITSVSGSVAFCVETFAHLGLVFVIPSLMIAVGAIGLIGPNATAIGLTNHADKAGSAAGVQGVAQYVVGAIITPLVGIAGPDTAVPMALVMVTVSGLALLQFLVFLPRVDPGR